jgi:hypothetical protein
MLNVIRYKTSRMRMLGGFSLNAVELELLRSDEAKGKARYLLQEPEPNVNRKVSHSALPVMTTRLSQLEDDDLAP